MIKLIAVDLDGTFFHERGKVSMVNVRALERARERGVKIVIATGRVYATSDPIIAPFAQVVDCISTCNGAAFYYPGNPEAFGREGIDASTAADLIDFLEREEIFYRCYINGQIYYGRPSASMRERYQGMFTLVEGAEGSATIQDNLAAHLRQTGTEVEKFFLLFPTPEEARAFRPRLPQQEKFSITSSFATNIELTRAGVDKGTGLAFLGKLWGIRQEEMMAIGDSENDLAMLLYAGESVAMGNALPEVKARCKHVTAKNTEDGVAQIIEKLVLIEEELPWEKK